MADTGTLKVRVYTSRGELPVADTSVSVVRHGERGQDLLALRTSGPNGTAEPIPIQSPPLQSSQSPGQPLPYALCDIWVERAGYHLLVVRGVQIFPGITSFQDLPLIPQNPTDGMTVDRVDITPQPL